MGWPNQVPTHGDIKSLIRRAFAIINYWLPKIHEHVHHEKPPESADGQRTQFSSSRPIKSGTLEVYLNGVRYIQPDHFTEDSGGMGYTISFAPPKDTNIVHDYEVDL